MVERLYTVYYEELLRFCLSLTGEPAAAEDIVQDTYLRAMENVILLGELSDAKCRAWLYRTAKNIFIDRFRRKKNEPLCTQRDVWEDDLSRMLVIQLCSYLPGEERALFWLRYMDGYNSTELGRIFGLPPSTVRAKLASARRKIAVLYNEGI